MQMISTIPTPIRASPYSRQSRQAYISSGVKVALMGKILIVVDGPERSQEVAEVLEQRGYSHKILHSSAELFRILPHFEPEILLVDQSIPGIGNIKILAFIRHVTEVGAMKVFVVMKDAETVGSAKTLWKADVALTSPVSPEALVEAVTAHL